MASITSTATNPFLGVNHPNSHQPLMDEVASRKAVQDIAHQVQVSSGHGKNRVGYLRINNIGQLTTDAASKVQVKSLKFFQRIFNSYDEAKASRSSDFLRNLLQTAYQGAVPQQELNGVLAAFDKHVGKLGRNGVGGRHFSKYVKQLELAALNFPKPGIDRVSDGKASAFAVYMKPMELSSEESKAHRAAWAAQVESNVRHLLASSSLGTESVSLLGEGAEGRAYSLGSSDILKVYNHPGELGASGAKHTIARRGDLAAIHAKQPMPHLALPEAYYLKAEFKDAEAHVEQTVFYKVQANAVRDFCEQIGGMGRAADSVVTITHEGTLMARADGEPLLKNKRAVDDPTFKSVALGLHSALLEMGSAKFMHNDIKPDNIIFNPVDQSLKLIDLGGLTKISDDPLRRLEEQKLGRLGSPPFQSPLAFRLDFESGLRTPHGAEADRYSYGMVLLASLEPRIMAPEFQRQLPDFFVTGPNRHGANRIAPEKYLESMLETLDKAFPNGSEALKERFEQQPLFKELVQQSFTASVEGAQAQQAWADIGDRIMPALRAQPSAELVGSVPGGPEGLLQSAPEASFDDLRYQGSFTSVRA